LLKEFLSKGKLPAFQLLDTDREDSRANALAMLNEDPPNVAELKRLIPDGIHNSGIKKQ
jgi:hypothetical protein